MTFHNIPNIGVLLQAYGLCTTIRKLGTECDLIDYHCDNIIYRELTFHPARFLEKCFGPIVRKDKLTHNQS